MVADRVFCLIFLVVPAVWWGCGKKTDPVPLRLTVPPQVRDLAVEVVGDRSRLTWALPGMGADGQDRPAYFSVYRYESLHPEDVCEGCPVPFEHVVDIRMGNPRPARIEDGRVIYHDRVQAGRVYAYKVVSHHKGGGVSKDSNVVWVNTKVIGQ